MHPATVHLLTAFFALCHRLALTEDDKSALETEGASLSTKLWRATAGLVAEADQGAPGTRVDIGFGPLLLRWLGVGDEAGFVETWGLETAGRLRARPGRARPARRGHRDRRRVRGDARPGEPCLGVACRAAQRRAARHGPPGRRGT